LKDVSLRLFAEHGSKQTINELRYQDKELVDVLLQFTRARERRAPASFWRKNLDVMDATIQLFGKVDAVLAQLYSVEGATRTRGESVVV
jgi:hypothetical protein